MGRGGEFRGVAGDIGNVRGELWRDFRPQYKEVRGWQRDLTDRIGQTGDFYRGMMEDPSKRGYSAETIANMRGNATGAIAGARRNALDDISRRTAASGLGNTGIGIRAGMDYGRDVAKQQREANRDVDLAAAEASRADLWNAGQGLAQNYGLQQQGWRDFTGGLNAENAFYNNTILPTFSQQMQAYEGANQPGFWGKFGSSVANNLGAIFNPQSWYKPG